MDNWNHQHRQVGRGRSALMQNLRRPARDHDGQIAALRNAVANTATSAPPLGLLCWPADVTLDAVMLALDMPKSRFFVVVDGNRSTWRHLYAASPSARVFDPCGVSQDPTPFAALVRGKRFDRIIVGIEACRGEIAQLAGEGVA
jgi:hypothetical protein